MSLTPSAFLSAHSSASVATQTLAANLAQGMASKARSPQAKAAWQHTATALNASKMKAPLTHDVVELSHKSL